MANHDHAAADLNASAPEERLPSTIIAETNEKQAIADAKAAFVCRDGYMLFKPVGTSRSVMYSYGVRTVPSSSTSDSTRKSVGYFHCFASKNCREAGTVIRLTHGATSSATDHLLHVHGICSQRSQQLALRKEKTNDKVTAMLNSKLFEENRGRILLLEYTKGFTVLGLLPFGFMEDEHRRAFLQALSSEDDQAAFPVDLLNARAIKKTVVELYDSTTRSLKSMLTCHLRDSAIPLVYLSVDVWTARASALEKYKYIGLRARFLTRDFGVQTFPMAVQRFKPAITVDTERAGVLVQAWIEQVLEEFGLDWSMIAGAVTDSDSDVRHAFSNVPAGIVREECIPHLLCRSIVDGFGLSLVPEKSKNSQARAVFMTVKQIIGHVRKSSTAKTVFDDPREGTYGRLPAGGLRQVKLHRWVSSAVTLERFLVCLSELRECFDRHNLAMSFSKEEVQEMYTLLKAIALVIESCRCTTTISGFEAMQKMIMMIQTVLNPQRPLLLHDARDFFKPAPSAGGSSGGPATATATTPVTKATKLKVRVAHEELTEVGRLTRGKVRDAVCKRFGRSRWGQDHTGESNLFDMVMALSPSSRRLSYIDALAPNPNVASEIREKVYDQVRDMAERVISYERARQKKGKSGSRERPPKKPRPNPRSREDDVVAMRHMAGLIDVDSDDDGGDDDEDEDEGEPSAAEEARTVVDHWRRARISKPYRYVHDAESLAMFWRDEGSKKFKVMSAVARTVLGAPPSAGVFERGFEDESEHFRASRQAGPSESGYAEMILFLREAYHRIPSEIPKLSQEEADRVFPARLKDPELRAVLKDISVDDDVSEGIQLFFVDSEDEEPDEAVGEDEAVEVTGRVVAGGSQQGEDGGQGGALGSELDKGAQATTAMGERTEESNKLL